ncbi:unnamed protein product [Discula destructiva]
MSSLAELCTVSHVQAALPVNGAVAGVDLIPSSVTANTVNSTSTYCNVTVSYTHTGRDDNVVLWYTFPSPDAFQNRYYSAGGFGYTLSISEPTGGLEYGAVSGSSDVGYAGFENTLDGVVLDGNGTLNWQNIYMFAYQAHGETAMVGKQLAASFYSVDDKIYTYFEGCSDGGREAMSQAQRYGDVYDGIVAGAPAFHHAQQQVNHLTSVITENTMGYVSPPCEMEKIATATIAACDPLDGRTDGVVARTDLCRLNFNLSSLIGESYYCAAETSSSLGFGFSKRQAGASTSSYQPEQNGTISAEAVALAKRLYDGLLNSKGEQVMYGWQTASAFEDAAPTWSNDTESWVVSSPDIGGTFITKFVEKIDIDNLESLDNITYDTLYNWMFTGYLRFYDNLQTGYTDLTPLQANGGKLLHYHGESDPSVPPPSSVRYYEAVRNAMFPESSPDSTADISDFYQFYLVPGAAHCGANTLQPGPFPQDNMNTMIDWVENGIKPTALNATVTSGDFEGEVQQLCQWPTRPVWASNDSTTFTCAFDEASYESWQWDLNAWKIPVY